MIYIAIIVTLIFFIQLSRLKTIQRLASLALWFTLPRRVLIKWIEKSEDERQRQIEKMRQAYRVQKFKGE